MNFRPTLSILTAAGALIVGGLVFAQPPARAADAGTTANAAPAAASKPYTVKDGDKVDMGTYKGYLYYGDQCMRCHGPDGLGSSYAPNLTDSLKTMSKETMENTVINGRQDVNTANDKVMPAFGTNQDVVENLDNIYAYLKARSDGALGRGHPQHIDQ
jgi:mono/diheme cytochrome c family protein